MLLGCLLTATALAGCSVDAEGAAFDDESPATADPTSAEAAEENTDSVSSALPTAPKPPPPACTATTDGGKWCCVPGPKGPICWKVPPPIIIST